MRILDNIKKFLKGENAKPIIKQENTYKKSVLSSNIMNLINDIKRIDSFDKSLWNLSNAANISLQNKSEIELEQLYANLSSRLEELKREKQKINFSRQSLEASKWTGQKPKNMTDYEFDRFQRDD